LGYLAASPVLGGEEKPPSPLDIAPVPKTEPPPSWLKAGLRLTYSSAAAKLATDAVKKTWNDVARRVEDMWIPGGGGGGRGYTQVTVVALDSVTSVLELRSFNFHEDSPATPVFVSSSGALGTPASGSDWWASPRALKQAREGVSQGRGVVREYYPLKGRKYKAIRLVTVNFYEPKETLTPDMSQVLANRLSVVYDQGTGILLFRSDAVQHATASEIAHSTFENVRPLRVPWAGSPAPSWVKNTSVLVYSGEQSVPIRGMRPVSRPVSIRFNITQRGANWMAFRATFEEGGPEGSATPATEQKAKGVCGSAQFGGLWVPPKALDALRPNQVLDVDPFTKFVIKVTRVGKMPDGRDVVVLSETGPLQRIDYTYDRGSGILLKYTRTDSHINDMRLELQLTGRK